MNQSIMKQQTYMPRKGGRKGQTRTAWNRSSPFRVNVVDTTAGRNGMDRVLEDACDDAI